MLFFWTFYLVKDHEKNMHHGFHKSMDMILKTELKVVENSVLPSREEVTF